MQFKVTLWYIPFLIFFLLAVLGEGNHWFWNKWFILDKLAKCNLFPPSLAYLVKETIFYSVMDYKQEGPERVMGKATKREKDLLYYKSDQVTCPPNYTHSKPLFACRTKFEPFISLCSAEYAVLFHISMPFHLLFPLLNLPTPLVPGSRWTATHSERELPSTVLPWATQTTAHSLLHVPTFHLLFTPLLHLLYVTIII